jgi:hypothetical protein
LTVSSSSRTSPRARCGRYSVNFERDDGERGIVAHFVVEEMHLLVGGGGLGHESESDTSGGLGSGVEDIEGLEGHGLESGLAVVTFGTVVLDGGGEGGGLVDVSVEPDGHGRRVEESEGTILGSERVERDVVGDEFVSSGLELGDLGLVAVPGSRKEVGSSSSEDCRVRRQLKRCGRSRWVYSRTSGPSHLVQV